MGFVFQQDGALDHQARDIVAFPEERGDLLHSSNTVAAEFTGSEPSLQGKVHQSRIANDNEIETDRRVGTL